MRKAIDILKESPLSVEALRNWIKNDFNERFKEEDEKARKVNPDFDNMRDLWINEQLQIKELIVVLEHNTTFLFSFFDTYNLFIEVGPDMIPGNENILDLKFIYMIFDEKMNHLEKNDEWYGIRKEANLAAVDEAFALLEGKLV